MSDKVLAIESPHPAPSDPNNHFMGPCQNFISGTRKGLEQIKSGDVITREEIKRQLAAWISK